MTNLQMDTAERLHPPNREESFAAYNLACNDAAQVLFENELAGLSPEQQSQDDRTQKALQQLTDSLSGVLQHHPSIGSLNQSQVNKYRAFTKELVETRRLKLQTEHQHLQKYQIAPQPDLAVRPTDTLSVRRPEKKVKTSLLFQVGMVALLALGGSRLFGNSGEHYTARLKAGTPPATTSVPMPPPTEQPAAEQPPNQLTAEQAQALTEYLKAQPPANLNVHPVFDGKPINPTAVVLHWTAAKYENLDHFIRGIQANGGASVQFFIDRNGQVHQLVANPATEAGQALGANHNSIGIEIEAGDPSLPPEQQPEVAKNELMNNQPQFESVVKTVQWLQRTYGITNESDGANVRGVVGHYQVAETHGDHKVDPSPEYVQKVLAELNKPAVIPATPPEQVEPAPATTEPTPSTAAASPSSTEKPADKPTATTKPVEPTPVTDEISDYLKGIEQLKQQRAEFAAKYPRDAASPQTMQEFLHWAASQYGTDGNVLNEMAQKESGYNNQAANNWDINAQNGDPTIGILQYTTPTFNTYQANAYNANPEAWAFLDAGNDPADGLQVVPDRADWRQQGLATAWAIKNGKGPQDWRLTWQKIGSPVLK